MIRTALLLTLTALHLAAQNGGQTPSASMTTGVQNYIHMVSDVDKAIAFYRTALGLDLERPIADRGADANIQNLTNTPGSKFRGANFKVPAEFGFEVAELTGVTRNQIQQRVQDPGTTALSISVRDMNAAIAGLKKAGATILTTGGLPIRNTRRGPEARNIFVRDPDGLLLEIRRPDPLPAGAPVQGNVLALQMSLTAGDPEKSRHFYGNLLGLTIQPGAPAGGPLFEQLFGLPGMKMTVDEAAIPGTNIRINQITYQGVERKPMRVNIQDPGASSIAFYVNDIEALLAKIKSEGMEIISTGGQPVTMGRNRQAFVRDPNGLLVELVQAGVRQ